jgi:hypothetical protein
MLYNRKEREPRPAGDPGKGPARRQKAGMNAETSPGESTKQLLPRGFRAGTEGGDHKPNSVHAAIYLGCMSPCTSSRPTHNLERAVLMRLPTWSCTGWGLQCLRHCCGSGELLPHLFTLAPSPKGWGGIFSVALSIASRRPDVIRHPALWCSDFPHRPAPEVVRGQRGCVVPSLCSDTSNSRPPPDAFANGHRAFGRGWRRMTDAFKTAASII